MPLLEIENLEVGFPGAGDSGDLVALKKISLTLHEGERIGIVGESGAGKSLTAFAILNLLSWPGRIMGGRILFRGEDLTTASARRLREIRGNRIAMIFQDPMMTLNPVMTIGRQMVESLRAHQQISRREARDKSINMLREVAISDPEARFRSYPHQLSGGMRQRVVIATALMLEPDILLADEPTTALDVTIQAEIMGLITELCRRHGTSLMLITHDIALVSQMTHRLAVFYAGRIVEEGPTQEVIAEPQHPYTRGLIGCLPQTNPPGELLQQVAGAMPSLEKNIPGCAFHPRCPNARAVCKLNPPDLWTGGERKIACYYPVNLPVSARM